MRMGSGSLGLVGYEKERLSYWKVKAKGEANGNSVDRHALGQTFDRSATCWKWLAKGRANLTSCCRNNSVA